MPSRMIWREYRLIIQIVIYIDSYWTWRQMKVMIYHYVFSAKASVLHQSLDILFRMSGIPEDSKYIYYGIEGIDSKTNDKVQKYFKLEL